MYGIFVFYYVVQITYLRQCPYYFVETFSSLLCPTETLCLSHYAD